MNNNQTSPEELKVFAKAVEITEVRMKLSELSSRANALVQELKSETSEDPNNIMSSIAEFEGIDIHEYRDCYKDLDTLHCGRFVFEVCLGESWPDLDNGYFWSNISLLLPERGYSPVPKEESGDVAIYCDLNYHNNDAYWMKHVGLVVEPGIIRSKFTTGHIFNHKYDIVPSEYGTSIVFYRKTPKSVT